MKTLEIALSFSRQNHISFKKLKAGKSPTRRRHFSPQDGVGYFNNGFHGNPENKH